MITNKTEQDEQTKIFSKLIQGINSYIYTHTNTHTHTHIYIYILAYGFISAFKLAIAVSMVYLKYFKH